MDSTQKTKPSFIKLTAICEDGTLRPILLNIEFIQSFETIDKQVLITIKNEKENNFIVTETGGQIVSLLEKAGVTVVK